MANVGVNSQHVYLPTPVQDATTGAVQVASVGIAAPADARTALGDGWASSIGYVGEDGLALSGVMASGDAIRDWAKTKIRVMSGDADPTIALPAVQIDADMLRLVVGDDNVSVTAATKDHGEQIAVSFDGKVGPARAWCFSMKDEGRRVRVFVPNAQVSDLGDLSFVPGAAHTYSLTLSLNSDANGKSVYVMYDDGEMLSA